MRECQRGLPFSNTSNLRLAVARVLLWAVPDRIDRPPAHALLAERGNTSAEPPTTPALVHSSSHRKTPGAEDHRRYQPARSETCFVDRVGIWVAAGPSLLGAESAHLRRWLMLPPLPEDRGHVRPSDDGAYVGRDGPDLIEHRAS